MDTQVLPFPRGKTHYGQERTIPTSDFGGTVDLEGMKVVFADTDPADTTKRRSGGDLHAICVRNVSGITLFKSQIVTWKSGYRGKRVDGYSKETGEECAGVIDDHLGTQGVRNNDLFWLLVDGQMLLWQPMNGDLAADLDAGAILYAETAAASTAKTTAGTTADDSGNFEQWDGAVNATQATDGTLTARLKNAFGRAISAASSTAHAQVLAYCKFWPHF